MSRLSIKPYQHGVSTYATRITGQEWHQYQQLLTDLHQNRISRPAMLKELSKRGFQPSIKQLNAQMRKWNLTAQCPSTDTTAEYGSTTLDDESSVSDCVVVNLNAMGEPKLASDAESLEIVHPSFFVHGSLPGLNRQLDSLSVTMSGYNQAMVAESPLTTASHCEDETLRVRLQGLTQKLKLFRDDLANSTIQVPSQCCCLDFFYGTGCFTKAENLYLSCLESSKSPMSLHSILMLINYLNACGHDHVDLRVQNVIHQTYNHYLSLAARADIKNIVVDSIIHELSDLFHNFTKSGIEFPKAESIPTNFIHWGELISPQLCPSSESLSKLDTPSLRPYTPDASSLSGLKDGHIRNILERCRTVLIGERYKIEAVLFWISTPRTIDNDHSVTLEQSTLIRLASYITSHLSNDLSKNPDLYRSDQACLSHHQLSVLLEAIGMLVMTKLGSVLQRDRGHSYKSFLDRVSYAFHSSIVELLPSDADSLAIQEEGMRTTSLELRRLCWIYGLDDVDPRRSNLHDGQCYFNALWTSLRTDIRNFDQERTWLEKQIFLNGQKTDRRRGLTGDNESMSVNTSSTDSSFKRFRAYAWNLASPKKQNPTSSQHFAYTLSDNFGFAFGSDIDDSVSQLHTREEREEKDQANLDLAQRKTDYALTTFIGSNPDLKLRDNDAELLFFGIGSAYQL